MKICKKIIAVLMILSVCLTFSISVNAAEKEETTAPETTSAASAGSDTDEKALKLFADIFNSATLSPASAKNDESDTAEKKISDSDSDDEKRSYDFSENTDGNAELVANEKVITDNGLFQFIAVTTRSGDVFYVIIDNSKEENNVYFLNDVDTFDLQALLSKDDDSDTVKVGESAEIEAATTESGAAENADSENKKESDSKQGGNYTSIFILLGIVVLGGIGFVIFKIKKGGFGKKKAQTDLLDDDFDDEFDDEAEINEDIEGGNAEQ